MSLSCTSRDTVEKHSWNSQGTAAIRRKCDDTRVDDVLPRAMPVQPEEKDPVIDGIYERLTENESEPVVGTFFKFGPLFLLVRQNWFDLKNTILEERHDKRHKTIFLRGTSGRGKTSFIYYLMYCILIKKRSKKRKVGQDETGQESEPVVGFVKNKLNNMIVSHLLTLSGARTVQHFPLSVCYYIADIKEDVNMTYLAQRFTMAVAPDYAGKNEFTKRVDEAGSSGDTFAMTSPTREEMHLIFSQNGQMSTEEIDFRLDVVGCNPHAFTMNYENYKLYPEFERVIEESCSEILNCGPVDTGDTGVARFNWVKGIVMKSIDNAMMASDHNKINMSSLFREDVIEGDHLISVYTSTFMCFLAGKIRDKFATDNT